ncbi:MAG: hypothetical protein K9G62_04790 [Alphaproteobacteria bacterium]|nr:hypothetical protein [Alphaproteobacteria bacterium]
MPQSHKTGSVIEVHDSMQADYSYVLSEPAGQNFAAGFTPHFSPKEMLALGVFEGKYCNDCQDEFPADWFEGAKISQTANIVLNYFGVKSRQSLQVWREKGWIVGPDPRGWFQWYCRYWMGRRIPALDSFQIKRWRAFARHAGQIRANCPEHCLSCRPRQRQGLLQWSHDPFI